MQKENNTKVSAGAMPRIAAGFRFLSSEASTLERAALLRDRLFAHTFGAGYELDIYYAAFRIPDLLFVAIGALVSVYILIPELVSRGKDGEKDYIDTIVTGFSVLAVAVAGLAALLAPSILEILFPRFVESGHIEILVTLTRIMLLQPILLGLSNILAAITQVRARYGLYALSPILYNLGIIGGIVLLYPLWGLPGLAWGVVIGASFHLGIQVPSIVADGFFLRIPRIVESRALLRTVLISVPRALALSVNQIAFVGLTALAATLAPGSIAVFMFAFNLNNVPLSIIGASYSVAAFPTLAAVAIAARHVLFWSLPAIALIVVLRAHIVRVVLGSGAFDWTDTRLTSAALALFSLSLAAQGLTLLLVRGYYAAGRTLVPLLVALAGATGTLVSGVLYLRAFQNASILNFVEAILRVEELTGTSVMALALAYASISILSTFVLALLFEYQFGGFFSAVRRTFFEGILAALAGGAGAYMMLVAVGPLTLTSTLVSVFLRGFAGGVTGIIVTALVYWLLRNREYRETAEAIRSKLWRVPKTEGEITVSASAEDVGPSRSQ
ncbi:MAG: Integral membrane protein MviN [Candidatus Kaiserbacteria bacterium GW2011_GWC2_49_12]|uniref:Integral membrane protein MviN n=1 Tax=Candidatus Kaiserbacteria bacterium GW2011_GWC2_49_12 TaxID=1618675 RepID=A0A0G1VGK0_9BACT|nr:MAG: Integral membrane protein MviN [Candidatus Kaiserbacteria bacterium GW2011_GWC2_49_12]